MLLDEILARIEAANPINGRKLRQRLAPMDQQYRESAEDYFLRYDLALRSEGKSIDFGIECYLKLCDAMMGERISFLRTGRYANISYKEVERQIYGNPEIMEYHMHGLAMAQYLWVDQYQRIDFFRKLLPQFSPRSGAYLEVGGGHGLYVIEALSQLAANVRIDLLDISASSIKLAEKMIGPSRVNYILKDLFEYEAPPYEFITVGEVIEHVEDPHGFLRRIGSLLQPDGTIFLTTPVNAPMIDHIYLFSTVQEIRDLIASAGFVIAAEKHVASEDLPEEQIIQHKLPIMYAAFLRKSCS